MEKYVILGARGGTGLKIAHALLDENLQQANNFSPTEIVCVVRDPSKVLEGQLPKEDKIKLVKGDASSEESLKSVLQGAKAVFFACAGRSYNHSVEVDWKGVEKVAQISKSLNVGRVVLISSQLVHPDNRYTFVRMLLNSIVTGVFKKEGIMDFKFKGECCLRKSGQEYTIIRPGRLVDTGAKQQQICLGQTNSHFMSGKASAREDVARVAVSAAVNESAANTTFEMACTPKEKGEGSSDVIPSAELFSQLKKKWGEEWEF